MRRHESFPRSGYLPFKAIVILASLLVLAILLSTIGRASAEENANLSDIRVTANGALVSLVPQFDPDTTHYAATTDAESASVMALAAGAGAGIDLTSVGDTVNDLDPPGVVVTTEATLTEGAITTVSIRVRAADGVTTKTYYLLLSRPADPAVPDITIQATPSSYVAGLGDLAFTITRSGNTTDDLDLTVNLTKDQPWVSFSSFTTTIHAGGSQATFTIFASNFSSEVVQSGELTATLGKATGYDTSDASTSVRVISQEGPAVSVFLDQAAYTVGEGAGNLIVTVIARAHPSVPLVPDFAAILWSHAQTATNGSDYATVSERVQFASPDFQEENDGLVGRKEIPIEILDDDMLEDDEQFLLHISKTAGLTTEVAFIDPEGEECPDTCPNPYVVTVFDNEPEPINVGLASIRTGTLIEEDLGRDWFSFVAIANENYIIEVKHPLTFDAKSRTYQQVPGYLADPSILEIIDSDDTQVLGEHDQGGFTLNWARAFFTPDTDGVYRIAVGAGAQDPNGLGSYTISVRVDDHADDYGTEPGVALEVGGYITGTSITGTIDSDVAPDDPDLEKWFWGGRGIEMLDDRDVFRFRIADAGEYQISLSEHPSGVGVRYIWDNSGNQWLEPEDAPVESFAGHYEPGTYYAEIGTPFESTGSTGQYVLTLEAVENDD